MIHTIAVGERRIGQGQPCFVIAEAGVNHNGDIDMAFRLVDVAVAAGADAVKFQTFTAENLVTADAPKARYQAANTGDDGPQIAMLKALELSVEGHHRLQAYCRQQGIMFLSSPFDEGAADFLAELDLPIFKVPSGEITNHGFLAHLAAKGCPIILSTGMSTLGEVADALAVIAKNGAPPVLLLHCTSNYPAAPDEVNLRAVGTMATAFGLPVGYSDHSEGTAVAVAAVALGACCIEKHFTLDRELPGPDHRASLEPAELTAMIRAIRAVELALGDGLKVPQPGELATRAIARKSLVAARDLPEGAVLGAGDIAVMRPGTGVAPAMRPHFEGRTLRRPVPRGTLLGWDMVV